MVTGTSLPVVTDIFIENIRMEPVSASRSVGVCSRSFSFCSLFIDFISLSNPSRTCSLRFSSRFWAAAITAQRTLSYMGSDYAAVNNGEQAQLTVEAPRDAQSGAYAVVQVYSTQVNSNGGDAYHIWPVGFYVP